MNLKRIWMSRLTALWDSLDERLAQDHPYLWGFQIHLAAVCIASGAIACLILVYFFAAIEDNNSGLALLVLVACGQLCAFAIWVFRVVQVPRPLNIVEYKNSPLLGVLAVVYTGMAAPLLLFYFYSGYFPKDTNRFVAMVYGYFLIFALMPRLSAFKGRVPGKGQITSVLGAAFFSMIAGGFVIGLNLAPLPVMGLIGAVMGIAACRVLVCVRAGWRSSMDTFWLAASAFLPPLCVTVLIFNVRTVSPTALIDGIVRSAFESDTTWTIYLAYAAVIVWIDLVFWVYARFSMLPAREA